VEEEDKQAGLVFHCLAHSPTEHGQGLYPYPNKQKRYSFLLATERNYFLN